MTNKSSIWIVTLTQLFQNSASPKGKLFSTVYRPPSKRPKNVCVFFSWNVTAIFEKLSCKKQRNAAERMLYLVSWENILRNDRVGSTQNHVCFVLLVMISLKIGWENMVTYQHIYDSKTGYS